MIHLVFTANREVLNFTIEKRVVKYTDRIFRTWIQCIPKDPVFAQKIIMSRNKLPAFLIEMFNFSKEEMDEYNSASDDEAIAKIIINDAVKKGCILEKKEEIHVNN